MSDNAGIGHNSLAGDQLKAFVERIENVNEAIDGLRADVKDVYSEAKSNGFDTKTIRRIVALRRKDATARREEEALLDLYMQALGMLD